MSTNVVATGPRADRNARWQPACGRTLLSACARLAYHALVPVPLLLSVFGR